MVRKTATAFLLVTLLFAHAAIPMRVIAEDAPPPAESQTTGEFVAEESSEIETGEAVSASDTTTTANVNVVDTEFEEEGSSDEAESPNGEGGNVDVSADNEADVETVATTTATTGDNNASSSSGSASVTTGDAYAGANTVNVVNANIFDSEIMLMFLNNIFGGVGNVDLRPFLEGVLNSSDNCDTCGGLTISASSSNSANVENNIVVRASSGGNSASSTGGSSSISTGDAYAEANLLNVVNTNIVDSSYLLMVFNNFGSWGNDLVLPGAELFSQLFAASRGMGGTQVSVNNSAVVNNEVNTDADSGGNSASGEGDTEITTGSAVASSNVVNDVNSTLLNSSSFRILFRIHGNWTGNLFSLPPGLTWSQTPLGLQIMLDPASSGSATNGGDCCDSSLKIGASNTASVNNNVSVYALTGENEAKGGSASIDTGNAVAVANTVNLVNTNIIGSNWLLAIVNIFGDWSGNIAFGRPDVWVGTRVEVLNNMPDIGPNTELIYHFTVANIGDAPATQVKIRNFLNQPLIEFDGYNSIGSARAVFDIGTVGVGEVRTYSFKGRVLPEVPFGKSSISNKITVTSFETDADISNNTDIFTIDTFKAGEGGHGYGPTVRYTPDPKLIVTKENDIPSDSAILASSTVNYKVSIKNEGGHAYHAFLEDTIKNQQGRIVSRNIWDLETIYPNEEITVEYQVFFNASSSPGVYTNEAKVEAVGRHPSLDPFYGYFADSNVASSYVTIYASSPLVWDYEPFVYATSTVKVGEANVTSQGQTKPAAPVDLEEADERKALILPPYPSSGTPWNPLIMKNFSAPVFLADIWSAPKLPHEESKQLANIFYGLPLPWNIRIDFLLVVILVVFLHTVNQSSPKYREAIAHFFSVL